MVAPVDPWDRVVVGQMHAVDAGGIDAQLVLIGPPVVMGIDATGLAEMMQGGVRTELIGLQVFGTLHDLNIIASGCYCGSAASQSLTPNYSFDFSPLRDVL